MNDNIHTKLKFIVFTLTILIILAFIVLTVLLIKKIKNKPSNAVTNIPYSLEKTINLLETGVAKSCEPIEVIFKEKYLAIYYKKCNIVKIINIY